MKCTFCGCTETRACKVKLVDQPPSIRQLIVARARERGERQPITTGCAWINHDPPVCSAPACVEKYADQLAT